MVRRACDGEGLLGAFRAAVANHTLPAIAVEKTDVIRSV